MKNVLVSLFLLLLITACTNTRNQRKVAFDFIPEDTFLAFKIRNLEALKSDKNNNTLFFALSKQKGISYLNKALGTLKNLNTDKDIIIAINSYKDNDSINYTYITRLKDSLFTNDSLSTKPINTSLYKSNTIEENLWNNQRLFSTTIDSFFVATTNKIELEKLIQNTSKSSKFKDVENLKSDASLSYYINQTQKTDSASSIASSLPGEIIVNDIDISEGSISLNGITKAKDSTQNFVSYLANSSPQENNIIAVIPSNSKSFTSYMFNNLNTFKNNHDAFNNIPNTETNEAYDLILEIGQFMINNNQAYALRSIDSNTLNEVLNTSDHFVENYRQTNIYALDSLQVVTELFSPFFEISPVTHLLFIEDLVVFTKTLEDAQNIISNYNNKTTIHTSQAYKTIADDIGATSSFLHFNYANYLDPIIASNLPSTKDTTTVDFKNNYVQVLQITNDNGFAHINSSIKEVKKKAQTNSISEAFTTSLDNDLISNPQVVKNHITGQKEIIVQDIENNVYLISNTGKILWKKQINGNILGNIEQVDIYKNGRLQLAFATPNRMYILDRNGKNVNPFPLKFNDEITQPLSVFDYDKKKKYRFLVVQGKNTIMYDAKGKTVNGFTFKSALNAINTQPKHFRVGSKDFIVFGAGKKMNILNRKGQSRVNVKEAITFSNNPILLYKNNFTTTNIDGQLIQVDQKGRINKQNLLLPKNHHVTSTSKTLATLADNELTIKTKTIALDFGDYTPPKIFYLKDKIYVSVTDLQTQKVYLFDSQAKLLPNFPVYGTSSIELVNIDKDKNLEFVVKGENNGVVLYKMN